MNTCEYLSHAWHIMPKNCMWKFRQMNRLRRVTIAWDRFSSSYFSPLKASCWLQGQSNDSLHLQGQACLLTVCKSFRVANKLVRCGKVKLEQLFRSIHEWLLLSVWHLRRRTLNIFNALVYNLVDFWPKMAFFACNFRRKNFWYLWVEKSQRK